MNGLREWLDSIGLGKYAEVFAENDLGLDVLPDLSDADLKELGLSMGDRKRLLKATAALQVRQAESAGDTSEGGPVTTPPPRAEAERRQLTVMFCDLAGSTALAERLDPEDLREVIHAYQDCCAGVIAEFGGFIARYVGDGILVYFGYPQAHEDDAERAIRAGLGIVDAMGRLRPRGNLKLTVRIGIATGLVVAGDHVGSGASEEKAVIGRTPNLAARLQDIAEPNTVVIGPSTFQLAGGLFLCDDLGPKRLKGFEEPVSSYRVREVAPLASRFEAMAEQRLTALVGREQELGLLLKRWEQAKDGEGQVVLVSGEAGIGKSRILRALHEHLEEEACNQVTYYCSAYHLNSALYPAIQQLERGLRFEKHDSEIVKLDKLDSVLREFDLQVPKIAPLLASLLSLPASDRYPSLSLRADELKDRILDALVTVFEAVAGKKPLLMIIEDVHWIDPSTLELLSLLIERLRTARILLVLAYRPEFNPPWRGHTRVTGLTLNHLSRKESLAMVARVAGGKAMPKQAVDEIVAKTEGIPLFVEELTLMMLESGLLDKAQDRPVPSGPLLSLAIPASLQGSLMARLDRLASVKEVAQLAAAIGRNFSHALLAAVSPLKGKELEGAIAQLLDAGLIYRRDRSANVLYEFKHTLVRDVAYQSLLKGNRQKFHMRIAEALETLFPETAETEPELLAHHFTEARLLEQAVTYWHRAGRRASERSANLETIAHLTKGLELLKSLPETPQRAEEELAMFITLGPALMAAKGWSAPQVKQAYERARELCEQVGEPSQLFTVKWGLWLHHQQAGKLDMAQVLADEVLLLAKGQAETSFLLQAHHAAWTTRYRVADLPAARHHAEQGNVLYDIRQHGSHAFLYGGHDPGVCCRIHAGLILWTLGYPNQALEEAHQGMRLAEELAHPFSLALANLYRAEIHQFRQEADLAQEYAEAVIALSNKHSFPQLAARGAIIRGWAVAARGKVAEGIAEMEDGLTASHRMEIGARRSYNLALLAETFGDNGQAEEGLRLLDDALNLIKKTGERPWEAETHRLRGEFLLAGSAGSIAEATSCFHRALEIAQRQSAKALELRAATSLARAWHAQAKTAEARVLLAPILDWFTEGLDTADLKNARALLDQLS